MKDKSLAVLGYLVLAVGLALLITAIANIGKPIDIPDASGDASSADVSGGTSGSMYAGNSGEYIADDEYKSIELLSQSAVVYDTNAGGYKVLKDSASQYSTGDFNLLVTALVALDKLGSEHNFVVTSELSLVPDGAATAGLQSGDSLNMTMMLDALLVARGADAAYVVAVETARSATGDSEMDQQLAVASFVSMMNSYAASHSLTNTVFTNPDGSYDSKQHSTAADMCKVAQNALNNSDIVTSTSKKAVTHTLNNGRSVTFSNNNKLLDNKSSAQYFDYSNGMLAWSLSNDINCLIATASIKGNDVVAVVLGGEKANDTYADAIALFYPTLQRAVFADTQSQ